MRLFPPFLTSFIILLSSFIIPCIGQDTTDVWNTFYWGNNLYIQNPLSYTPGYCVKKVLINGVNPDSIKNLKFELNSSAFEIPLTDMNFKKGDSVRLEITRGKNCTYKFLTYNLPPGDSLKFYDLKVDSNQVFTFKTKYEVFKNSYVIESYKWNKWVQIAEVQAYGSWQENSYSVKLSLHSGKNKIRIKAMKTPNSYIYSEPYSFWSKVKPVYNYADTIVYLIELSSPSNYELYDAEGNLVKKGYSKVIMCTDLKNGTYYLNYDNKSCEIRKVNLEDFPK